LGSLVTLKKGGVVYTTGQVARMCGVTKRSVIKWIDSGKLKGYTIPGSKHRRVSRADLLSFMGAHGIPNYPLMVPRRRILIVDDDADFAELLRDALRDQYDIEVAPTALEAAAKVSVFQPDILLVDVRLPDVNGLELCRQMQALAPACTAPILAMSAYGSEVDLKEVRRSGAVDFLPKPVKIGELKTRIQTMVG
jgi:two-component system, OmpR family, response regulator